MKKEYNTRSPERYHQLNRDRGKQIDYLGEFLYAICVANLNPRRHINHKCLPTIPIHCSIYSPIYIYIYIKNQVTFCKK